MTLGGQEIGPPWAQVHFDANPDWEWRTGPLDAPDEVHALWRGAVARGRVGGDRRRRGGGTSGGFSLDAPWGVLFVIRSLLLTGAEQSVLERGI